MEDPNTAEFYKDLQKTPGQYFKENFYVTTSGMFWEPALQFVSKVLGAERILFAVDYPYESMKKAVKFLDSAQMIEKNKEMISHLNAEKLLGL